VYRFWPIQNAHKTGNYAFHEMNIAHLLGKRNIINSKSAKFCRLVPYRLVVFHVFVLVTVFLSSIGSEVDGFQKSQGTHRSWGRSAIHLPIRRCGWCLWFGDVRRRVPRHQFGRHLFVRKSWKYNMMMINDKKNKENMRKNASTCNTIKKYIQTK